MKNFWKYSLIGILVFMTLYATTHSWVFVIDDANLIFHEAGHVFFAPFGEFLATMGGTIFQILLPLIFVIYFIKKQELISAQICFWWVGENMIGIGRYIADASSQRLVLIGGDHDWALILSRWPNLMRYDEVVGNLARIFGIVIMWISVLYVLKLIIKKSPQQEGNEF